MFNICTLLNTSKIRSSESSESSKKTLVHATREIWLEVSADGTMYLVRSRDQNAGRIHSVRMDNSTFERVEEFIYLGTTLTSQILLRNKLRADWVREMLAIIPLFSRLLSKNVKIKIYGTIILSVVLYGCETWSLTLREERKLKVFENKVLRRISGPRRDEVTGDWRRLHN